MPKIAEDKSEGCTFPRSVKSDTYMVIHLTTPRNELVLRFSDDRVSKEILERKLLVQEVAMKEMTVSMKQLKRIYARSKTSINCYRILVTNHDSGRRKCS